MLVTLNSRQRNQYDSSSEDRDAYAQTFHSQAQQAQNLERTSFTAFRKAKFVRPHLLNFIFQASLSSHICLLLRCFIISSYFSLSLPSDWNVGNHYSLVPSSSSFLSKVVTGFKKLRYMNILCNFESVKETGWVWAALEKYSDECAITGKFSLP